MFDGVCFMINANMGVGTCKGSLIARMERIDKRDHDEVLAEPHTRLAGTDQSDHEGLGTGPTGGRRIRELSDSLGRQSRQVSRVPSGQVTRAPTSGQGMKPL